MKLLEVHRKGWGHCPRELGHLWGNVLLSDAEPRGRRSSGKTGDVLAK